VIKQLKIYSPSGKFAERAKLAYFSCFIAAVLAKTAKTKPCDVLQAMLQAHYHKLWCMLENIHESRLLQPMASCENDFKVALAPRAGSLEMLARIPT